MHGREIAALLRAAADIDNKVVAPFDRGVPPDGCARNVPDGYAAIGADDGEAILNAVHAFLGRFVAYPSEAAHDAHALWIVHTHLMDAWVSTPRIAFLSPEPASGKTRALEISELLVPRPVEAVNVTPAYLFRKVADAAGRPTILFDEIDTVFGPKAKDNEEIRAFSTPAIAAAPSPAAASRAARLSKQKRSQPIAQWRSPVSATCRTRSSPDPLLFVRDDARPGSASKPYRRRVHADQGHELRERIEQWATSVEQLLRDAWPDMPAGITDRDADVWEPLLALADEAGGGWPERARVTAVTLVTLAKESTPSLGMRLLADLREVFADHEALPTKSILQALCLMDESPWMEIKGKALNDRTLASKLRRYEIKPKVLRIGATTLRGYQRSDFLDAWSRYLVVKI